MSEQESDIEEENEEENWVVGSREPKGLHFTADRGLNADLPDNPSFIDYFYLIFPEQLLKYITRQTNKYAREIIASLRERGRFSGYDHRYGPCEGEYPGLLAHR